ncbi:MAG: phosphate ABC transporter substrate-binding protein [Gammaproteobacteria bacterium]|nr:phosphate ABC transporter substrate-binding protein [Gammaproteobacteria bacterium]
MNSCAVCSRLLLVFSLILLSYNSYAVSAPKENAPQETTQPVKEINNNVIRWAGCGITKQAFMAEMAAGFEKKTGVKVDLKGGGATKGIRETAKLHVDVGASCRMTLPEADPSELHATLVPVAWDALAIIVHKSNKVNTLTTAQVKAIYKGTITNWSQVGGADAPIELFVRDGKISGVGYALRQYLFQNSDEDFVTEHVFKSSGPLEKAVEKTPNSIGITGVSSARRRNVKIIGFDNKVPTYENVQNGSYGLYRPLYLVTSPSPSKNVKLFVDYALSGEGKEIMRKNGTVPYTDALNLMRKLVIYGFGVQ